MKALGAALLVTAALFAGFGCATQTKSLNDLHILLGREDSLTRVGNYEEGSKLIDSIARDHASLSRAPEWVRRHVAIRQERYRTIRGFGADQRTMLARSDTLSTLIEELYGGSEYVSGLALAREQLDLRQKLFGPDGFDAAEALNFNFLLLLELGDLDQADSTGMRLARILETIVPDDHPLAESFRVNWAYLLEQEGHLDRAEVLYRRDLALAQQRAEDDPLNVAIAINNLSDNLFQQGDHDQAADLMEEALRIRRAALGDTSLDVAQSLNNLGNIRWRQAKFEVAADLAEQSQGIHRLSGWRRPDEAAAAEQLLGSVLVDLHDDKRAIEVLQHALELRRRTLPENHPRLGQIRVNLAQALLAEGKLDQAEHELVVARSSLEGGLGRIHPWIVRVEEGLGDVAVARGNFAMAERHFGEAARVYDACRQSIGSGRNRDRFIESPYPALAAARLAKGDFGSAWDAAERFNARTLGDILINSGARALEPVEAAREDSLGEKLLQARAQVTELQSQETAKTGSVDRKLSLKAKQELFDAEAAWATFQTSLRSRHTLTEGEAWPLDRVQHYLRANEAILGWLPVRRGVVHGARWAYVLKAAGPVTWIALPVDSAGPLESEGERIAVTRGKEPVTDALARVWDQALAPVLGELNGIRDLVLIPSPELMGFPLEAAASGSVPLGERFVVSYAPSATLFAWGRSRAAATGSRPNTRATAPRILALADPPFQKEQARAMAKAAQSEGSVRGTGFSPAELRPDQLPRLTHSRDEVEALRPFAGRESALLLGPQCREEAIVKMAREDSLERFDLIHIATHTLVNRSFPERSALVLSQVDLPDRRHALVRGERLYDGLITVEEVLREWKLNADLVSLSACQTGLGKKAGGEGYLGFAQAFLQKGAKSLVVSLWSVDDQSTSLLFKRFYADLLTSKADQRPTKAEALQEAKAWLRAYKTPDGRHPYSHPYYWAGFILLGDRD